MDVSSSINKYHICLNKQVNSLIHFYMAFCSLKYYCKSRKCKLLQEYAALLPNVVAAHRRRWPGGGVHNAQITWESRSTDEIAQASAASGE